MTFYPLKISEIQLEQIELLKGILETGTSVQLKSSGNSMFPIIRSSEILTIQSKKKVDLERGDVVVFQKDENLICHRIKRILPNEKIETQGDSCMYSDGEISRANIFGVVINGKSNVLRLKAGKFLSNLLGQAYNFICHFLLKIKFQKEKFYRI